MAAEIIPLDPDSPTGRIVAQRLTEVLGEIKAAIWARKAAGASAPRPGQPTPAQPPSRPPSQPPRPVGPAQPSRAAA